MEETIVPAPDAEATSDASTTPKVEENEAVRPPRVRKIRKVLKQNENGEELTGEFDVKEDGTAQLVGFAVRKRKAVENTIQLNGGERHQLKRTIKRRIVSKDLAQSIQNSASLVALLGGEVVSAATLHERWDTEGLGVVSTTQVRRSVMRLTPEQLARSAKAASSNAAKKARTSAATSSRSKAKVAKKEEVKDSDESDAASSADEADRTSSKSKRAQAAAKKKKESAKSAAKKTAKKEADKKRGTSAASKKAKKTTSSSSKKSKKDSDATKKASSKSSKKRAREESDNEDAKAKGAKRSAKKKAKVEDEDDEGERPKPPPIPFSYIKKNMYLHRSMRHWSSDEVPVCNCRLVSGKKACGENCINRVLNIECKLKHCPCGTNCSNRQFQLRKYAKIDRFLTGKKGWGLRAREKIPKGTFIIEYVGEVISTDMCQDRMKYYEEMGLEHYYFLTLDGSECIDASQKGNLARFINHSCNPNAKTHKWTVDKEIRVGIFAEEDIPVGQEITFDYQFERFGGKKQKCFCGETNCRGFLGAKPKKLLHQRRKEYASRAIMGRPRDNVINPLTVEAVLEHALQFNPINKVKLDVLFPESDQQPSPALGAGPPMSPPLLATAVAQMSPAARSEFMSSLPPIVPVFLRRNAIRVHRQCFVKYHQLKGAVVVATQPDDTSSSSSLGSARSSSATTTATTAAKAKAAARRGGRASTGGRAKANGKSRTSRSTSKKKKTKKESSSSSSSSSSSDSSSESSSSSSSSESSSSEDEEDKGANKSASKSRRKKAVADSKKKKKTTTTKQKAGKSKRKATTTKARGTKAKAKKAVSESESESDEKKEKVKERKVEKEDVPDSEREEEQGEQGEEEEKAGKEDKRNDAEGSGGDKMEEEPKEEKASGRPDVGEGGVQTTETKEKGAGGDHEMVATTAKEGKGAGPQQDDNDEGDDDAALRGESGPEDEGVDNNNKGDAMDVAQRTDTQ